MLEQENRLRIAVLQEQMGGLREQQRAHYDTTQRRFNALEDKIDELTAVLNRGRGAYAASMALAAGIGAFLVAVLELVTSYFHK